MSRLLPQDVEVIFYHSPCSDGTGSAWVVYHYFKNVTPTTPLVYIPSNYNSELPKEEVFANKNVLICDFSFKKDVLLNIIKKAKNLLIIDHHKTAQQDLLEISDNYKIFDMNHSGAYLTWMYFFPDIKPPLMIEYIQDRDIWTNKMQYIDAYAAWFYTLEHDVKIYDLYLDDAVFQDALINKGVGMALKDKYYTENNAKYAVCKLQKFDSNKIIVVAYLNSAILKSELGNSVINKYKHADIAAIYSVSDYDNTTSFSLRSTNNNYDCSEIAKLFFGGGHRNASGLSVKLVTNTLPGVIYDGFRYDKLEKIYFENNIVYLQSEHHKLTLGSYLISNKYNNVQQCANIIKIRDKLDQTAIANMPRVNIAAVWHYDAVDDITYFTISYDANFTDQTALQEFKTKFNIDENNKISYGGIFKSLCEKI